MKSRQLYFFLIVLLCLTFNTSCAINRLAVRVVANALTGKGSSEVFTGDNDPALVGDALPFAIKMYEALLSYNPYHEGLIITTGSLFVIYANAFVQLPAQMLSNDRFSEREIQYKRAKQLYLRGIEILERGLEKKYPGIGNAHNEGDLDKTMARVKKDDTPLLYWTVAGTLSAYSLDPFDLDLGLKIPLLKAYIKRAYELDPDFNDGAIDDFYITFYASLPASLGGNPPLAEVHFKRALEKSGGLSAGPFVSYAQAVLVPAQDYPGFKEYLNKALAVDVNINKSTRLVNIISQHKARFLLDNAPRYFFDLGEDTELFFGAMYDDYDEDDY